MNGPRNERLWSDYEQVQNHTRAQALAVGALVDVSEQARIAGIVLPVALTRAVWELCVVWTPADTARRGVHQDQEGRLWALLTALATLAHKTSGDRVKFHYNRIPNDGPDNWPRIVALLAACTPGDTPAPVITVMMPEEG